MRLDGLRTVAFLSYPLLPPGGLMAFPTWYWSQICSESCKAEFSFYPLSEWASLSHV